MAQFLQSLLNFFLKPTCPMCDRPAEQTLCIYCDQQRYSSMLQVKLGVTEWHDDFALLHWSINLFRDRFIPRVSNA
jgi:hypothetical protein